MTIEQAFIAALTVCSAIMGWLARELWSAVQKLRVDLDSLRVHIAEDYVRQDRMEKAMEPVLRKLDQIQDALSHKVDK